MGYLGTDNREYRLRIDICTTTADRSLIRGRRSKIHEIHVYQWPSRRLENEVPEKLDSILDS